MDSKKLDILLRSNVFDFYDRIPDLNAEERRFLETKLTEIGDKSYERLDVVLQEGRIDPMLDAADTAADYGEKLLLLTEEGRIQIHGEKYIEGAVILRQGVCKKHRPEEGGEHSVCGQLGEEMRRLKKDIEAFENPKQRDLSVMMIVIAVVGIVLAYLLFFNPGVKEFFSRDWVENGAVALGVLGIIGSFFVGGFVAAIAVAVVLALLFSFFESVIGLGVLLRILLGIVMALVGGGCAFTIGDELKKRKTLPGECARDLQKLAERFNRLVPYVNACGKKAISTWGIKYYNDVSNQLGRMNAALTDRFDELQKQLKR